MLRKRVGQTRTAVSERLESAFLEDYSPQEVAGSFALGLFITALPTLGTGVLVFLLLVYLFKQVSKIALFASVLVLNPAVKWGVYASSYWLGQRLLGPVPGVSFDGVDLSAGPAVLTRLWLGNLILACVFATIGYVLALRLVLDLRRRLASDPPASVEPQ